MLIVGAALVLLAQGPDQSPPQSKATEAVAVRKLSDGESRTTVAAYYKAVRKGAKLGERMRAVEALGEGQHDKLVKPLARTVLRDPSVAVRKTAARLLGHQPPKTARPALLFLLEDAEVRRTPEVLAAVIRSLSTAGYRPADYKRIRKLFERQFDAKYAAVQQAILELVTLHKEKQALPLLLAHLDEPIPVNVNDPANPPAEYWEKRWKAWRGWRPAVVEALFSITGQRFSNRREAERWIKANRVKLSKK